MRQFVSFDLLSKYVYLCRVFCHSLDLFVEYVIHLYKFCNALQFFYFMIYLSTSRDSVGPSQANSSSQRMPQCTREILNFLNYISAIRKALNHFKHLARLKISRYFKNQCKNILIQFCIKQIDITPLEKHKTHLSKQHESFI